MCLLQRFKGTEPVEEVTEQVKAAKIEDKPKEVKTEAVDEVPVQKYRSSFSLCGQFAQRPLASHRVHPSSPSRC